MTLRTGVSVWDVPIRLFHWLLVALFGFSWWSAEQGHLDWHKSSGLSVLTLLAFRLAWGLVGSNTARFTHFLKGPSSVRTYLRDKKPHQPGHNPLGGWSVVTMLALLCVQVGTGLVAVDVDGIESGPLSDRLSFDSGRAAAAIHHISFDLLLILIGLHVLSIGYYLIVKRRNLLTPMITGRDSSFTPDIAALVKGERWVLTATVAISALLTYWIANGAPYLQ